MHWTAFLVPIKSVIYIAVSGWNINGNLGSEYMSVYACRGGGVHVHSSGQMLLRNEGDYLYKRYRRAKFEYHIARCRLNDRDREGSQVVNFDIFKLDSRGKESP